MTGTAATRKPETRTKIGGPHGSALNPESDSVLKGSEGTRTGVDVLALISQPMMGLVKDTKPILWAIFGFSAVANILLLAGPLFMLQVYDRVLASRSQETLFVLFALVILVFVLFGFLDALRMKLFDRIGRMVVLRLTDKAFQSDGLAIKPGEEVSTPTATAVNDVMLLRQISMGPVGSALMDLPWSLVFAALLFLFHPFIGLFALAGVGTIAALSWWNEARLGTLHDDVLKANAQATDFSNILRRDPVSARAMGMTGLLGQHWWVRAVKATYMAGTVSDLGIIPKAATKSIRMILQSGILAVGALLVIHDAATPGIMIAASILAMRLLQPVEMALSNLKAMRMSVEAAKRLDQRFIEMETRDALTHSLKPRLACKNLTARRLTVTAPGTKAALLRDVTFSLNAGDGLAVVGPTASGKTVLLQAIPQAITLERGFVRLDGVPLVQWSEEERAKLFGYLPQDALLPPATVSQLIARFAQDPDEKMVMEAAEAASVHEVIAKLPKGYDTPVGPGGVPIAPGVRQRLLLARALYSNPFILLLDEPGAHLDAEGDAALNKAITDARARGAIVIAAVNRPSMAQALDQIMILHSGRVVDLGPKDKLLARDANGASAYARQQQVQQPQAPNARGAAHVG